MRREETDTILYFTQGPEEHLQSPTWALHHHTAHGCLKEL